MNPRATSRALYVLLAASSVLLGGCLDRKLKALNPCLVSGVVAEIAVTNIDKVDLLFMVDNSFSMKEEQATLRREFPDLIRVLTTGDRGLDGNQDFPPAKDLHLGVVSSDLGLVGISGIRGCEGLGDDGKMNQTPTTDPGVTGCKASYPARFLSYNADLNDPMETATDFSCLATLGTDGCGFEQQLESALKAVWPSDDTRVSFLPDVTMFGQFGQGDPMGANAGFLRNDVTKGLSLIAIIVVTDEEDCSSKTTKHFTPDPFLLDADPLKQQGLNTRCFHNKDNLYKLDERYLEGFKALRPGNENLVIFAGIVGVPVDLVTAEEIEKVDFDDEGSRNAFYGEILAHPAMQEMVDNRGTADTVADDNLVPSCGGGDDANSKAYPPIRIVQLAQMFGANGVIQSICQDDFGPAMDAIIAVIAKQLGAVCLPRELVRDAKGLVGCDVVWELPPSSAAPAGTPTECGEETFLQVPDGGRDTRTDRGGNVCKVAQLAVKGGVVMDTTDEMSGITFSDGWYYDNFSDEVQVECTGETRQRVAFTPDAKPPTGVTVKLECLDETQSLADSRLDVVTTQKQPRIGNSCVDEAGDPVDSKCHVALLEPTEMWPEEIDRSMFCHPEFNVCVLSCSTDAECPAAWVCDDRPETKADSGDRAFCVNPTCGGAS